MAQQKLGQHGQRILSMIRSGKEFQRYGDGWRCGATFAPDSVVQALVKTRQVRLKGNSVVEGGKSHNISSVIQYGTKIPMRVLREVPLADVEAGIAMRNMVNACGGQAPPAVKERKSPTTARSVMVNIEESPLSWLYARKLVTARQYQAGERLRRDWTLAGMAPHVTMQWDKMAGSSGGAGVDGPTLTMLDARKRLDGAEKAAGSGLVDILWRVVCHGEGLVAAESALAWPRRSAKLVLLMALDRVADYYRITG